MKYFIIVILFLALLSVHVKADDISIDSVTSTPQEASPGENIDVGISLTNIGTKKIKEIVIRLDLSQVPFAPIGSSADYVIKELEDGESTTVFFKLVALPNTSPGIYKIPLQISSNNTIKNTLISLKVQVNPQLLVEVEKSDIFYPGVSGNIFLRFVNKGLSDIKSLNVKVQNSKSFDLLSSSSIYIGNIDIDDSQTEEFRIVFKEGYTINLPLNLEYRDSNNNIYQESKVVSVKAYSLEEAKRLGLVKSNGFSIWIVLIISLILVYIIYKRIRKGKSK